MAATRPPADATEGVDVPITVGNAYLDRGVLTVSPFESLDVDGVGRLIDIATREGRRTRPGLKTGVFGEHGGDPESIHFFHRTGLDHVSCSPFGVPIARLEAGRAVLGHADPHTADPESSRDPRVTIAASQPRQGTRSQKAARRPTARTAQLSSASLASPGRR